MLNEAQYFAARSALTGKLTALVELERDYTKFLVEAARKAAPQLHRDFIGSRDLLPGWISYPPKQKPSTTADFSLAASLHVQLKNLAL